jgi:hypothetical protein
LAPGEVVAGRAPAVVSAPSSSTGTAAPVAVPAPVITTFGPNTGTAGTAVAIELIGRNFAAGSRVDFAGILIAPNALSSTTIGLKVTLPATAGSVPIRVVVPGNQVSNEVFFTVTAP